MSVSGQTWICVLFFLGGWAAWGDAQPPVEAGAAPFDVRESPGLGQREFMAWLDAALRNAQSETARREKDRDGKTRRWRRLAELETKGFSAKLEVAAAGRQQAAAAREWEADLAYERVVKWLSSACGKAVFAPSRMGPAAFYLHLPGVSQRVGGVDYFTLKLNESEAIRQALNGAETGVSRSVGGGSNGAVSLVRLNASVAPLTPDTVALAELVLRARADARAEMRQRKAQWDEAKRRLCLVDVAVEKEVANGVEQRRAQVAVHLAESAWNEAEARSRLAQLEWTRFQALSHGTVAGGLQETASAPWVKIREVEAEVRRQLGRGGSETLQIKELLRLGREAMRAVVAVDTARDERDAAGDLVRKLEDIAGVRAAERESARLALELAEAVLQGAEESRMEALLTFHHQAGLCGLESRGNGETWSLPNAAAWGKRIAVAEAEIALYRKEQAEIRMRHEQERLVAMRPLLDQGAASAYEVRKQELTFRMAEGRKVALSRNEDRIGLKSAFLEAIKGAAPGASLPDSPIPHAAWPLLADYASGMASACPGQLEQLEAGCELAKLRQGELERLRKAGLARAGELRETEFLSRTYAALLGAELAKSETSSAVRNLIGAASVAHSAPSPEKRETALVRVIQVKPLP